jgi:hypothetical protein
MPAVLKERACQPCFNGYVHVELNFRVTRCRYSSTLMCLCNSRGLSNSHCDAAIMETPCERKRMLFLSNSQRRSRLVCPVSNSLLLGVTQRRCGRYGARLSLPFHARPTQIISAFVVIGHCSQTNRICHASENKRANAKHVAPFEYGRNEGFWVRKSHHVA